MTSKFFFQSLAIFISITFIFAVAEANEDISDLIDKGLEAENATQYDEALSYFDRVLQIEPDNLQALNAKGVIFAKLGKYDDALSYFDRILEIEPDNVEVLNNKIALLADRGKLEDATQNIDKILEIEPDNVEGLYLKGYLHLKMAEYEKALSYINRVLQIEPDNLKALNAKGAVLQDLEEYDKALSYFDRILEIEPDYVDALFGKGGVVGSLGDSEMAIIHFLRVQVLDPNYAGIEKNIRLAMRSFPPQELEGNVMIHLRNSEGKLIMYQELPHILAFSLNITSHYLDTLDVIEIIKREDKEYEVLQERGFQVVEKDTVYAVVTMHPDSITGFPVLKAFNYGYPVQKGDVLSVLWTVIRPVS